MNSDVIARRNILLVMWMFIACVLPLPGKEYDFPAMIQPVPATAKFEDPGFIVWCGSMVRGADGKYPLFYSRWPRELGHYAWVSHSVVARAAGQGVVPFRR